MDSATSNKGKLLTQDSQTDKTRKSHASSRGMDSLRSMLTYNVKSITSPGPWIGKGQQPSAG